ncbi:MAG: mitochondral 37S ribosomal protein S27 [Geoglossum simile]|nr:MAG: mitochondral 37S ribosomal protein S27 [Geoglossum simile]
MSVARSRILDLMKAQCRIFSTTYNPERLRTGSKVLRQRLRGPTLAAYYPRRVVTLRDLKKAFPDCVTWDEKEEDRLENIQM